MAAKWPDWLVCRKVVLLEMESGEGDRVLHGEVPAPRPHRPVSTRGAVLYLVEREELWLGKPPATTTGQRAGRG